MKTINPKWVEVIKNIANPCPYFDLQQMEIVDITWGASHLKINIEKRHMQPFGVVHGGVFASLIDATGFWAVFSMADQTVGMTTVDLKINFLSPAISGTLVGLGRCIKIGRSIGLGEARIENEKGRLLAHGTTTVMIMADLHLPEPAQRTPKYI